MRIRESYGMICSGGAVWTSEKEGRGKGVLCCFPWGCQQKQDMGGMAQVWVTGRLGIVKYAPVNGKGKKAKLQDETVVGFTNMSENIIKWKKDMYAIRN